MNYKTSRYSIYQTIIHQDKTKDGYYWTPWSNKLIFETRKKIDKSEKDFFYPREMFTKKMYFNDKDLDLFMAKKEINDAILDNYIGNNCSFYDTHKDLLNKNLKDIVGKYSITVEDIIDGYEYIKNRN